ncbi:DUF262 domain-containing protein [Miniphocaeibacter massiliensis]|uniref:DUF262 domain-containing protein n=1 Tax=Miniphocaeibacter massiliensis TaxID=2041841 RepID=UPI000C1BD1C9|nr:DUF262 domain-containing protein [Miniphocaeibacter massiliensis]
MQNAVIGTRTILELKDLNFYIPSYQRGYRWTKDEVEALFEDINEFLPESGNRYCIQPLIVKRRKDGSFEVVDGQQRLTTIFIFMKIAEQEIRSAKPPYSVEFETRKNSSDFLNNLSDDVILANKKHEFIDYYYISNAYEYINEWLDKQEDKSVAIQELNTKIRKYVFFIWYEIPDNDDPVAIFTKVNLGKIPLTNSELIKALILNSDNFNSMVSNDIVKEQLELSISWDRIEQGLREDSFWYFLNETEEYGTRIDMLFLILAKSISGNIDVNYSYDSRLFPFLVLQRYLKIQEDKKQAVKYIWDLIEKLYSEFREWYKDLQKYHLIGYLITSGVSIEDIFKLTRNRRKSEIVSKLIDKVEQTIGKHDVESLVNLSYDNSYEKKKIKRVLLLHNLATLITKSEKQYRFPFDIFKNEKWDLEHIHATADESDESDDTLRNLVLLDAATNRGYKEAPYQDKRKIILEKEKNGLFVPLCTKNVFLKAYSTDFNDMEIWNEHDKKSYLDNINEILNTFFLGGSNNE